MGLAARDRRFASRSQAHRQILNRQNLHYMTILRNVRKIVDTTLLSLLSKSVAQLFG